MSQPTQHQLDFEFIKKVMMKEEVITINPRIDKKYTFSTNAIIIIDNKQIKP